MDITYPSIQSVNQYYGTDAITILNNLPGPVTDSGKTFSLCLYTNCQPPYQMTPCNYEIISIDTDSLVGTILGTPIDNWGSSTVTPAAPAPSEPETPEEPKDPVLPDSANAERARELAVKAEEFYASLAGAYDIEAEKALEGQFSDMYAESAARARDFSDSERETMPLEEYLDKSEEKAKAFDGSGGIRISVGAGEIAEVMKSVSDAAAKGLSLEEALSGFAADGENSYVREKSGSANADLLWIDTESGEVTAAVNKGRLALEGDLGALHSDDEAVLSLADDLAAFIRYAMFSGEDVDRERVQAFLAHLIKKQVYADYNRYIQDLDSGVDTQAVMNVILERLAAAFAADGGLDSGAGGEENAEDETVGGADNGESGAGVSDNEEESVLEPAPGVTPEEELEEIIEGLREN